MRRRLSSLAWRKLEEGAVWSTAVPKPWKKAAVGASNGAQMLRAERLVSPEVLSSARALLPGLRFDRDADSVDRSPTFELRWVHAGRYTHRGLENVFKETVETRILPLLRNSSLLSHISGLSGELVLCEALIRVYEEGARRVHPAHYDADALVTAVLEIDTSSEGAPSFEGAGFYVQPGAHVSSRIPITMGSGDVIAHSFDLQHG